MSISFFLNHLLMYLICDHVGYLPGMSPVYSSRKSTELTYARLVRVHSSRETKTHAEKCHQVNADATPVVGMPWMRSREIFLDARSSSSCAASLNITLETPFMH